MKKIYKKEINIDSKLSLYENLYNNKIYGPTAFYKMGIKNFIVNSQAANNILQSDLVTTDVHIHKIFHPVFTLDLQMKETEKADNIIIVGTFGIPGFDKKTDLIIEAVKYLNRKKYNIKLIIAGYSTTFFSYLEHIIDTDYMTLIESPSEKELLNLMQSINVAVQLRLNNYGESSGIVPQLLSLKKSVIVTKIGSFIEFENSVSYIETNATKIDIANKILEVYKKPIDDYLIDEYVYNHSPKKFREQLFSVINF